MFYFLLSGKSILLTTRAGFCKIGVSVFASIGDNSNDAKKRQIILRLDRGYFNCYSEESEKPQELMLGGGDTCQGDSGGPLIRSELPEVLLL